MNRTVLLDAGPLGLLSHPKPSEQGILCIEWIERLLSRNVRVIVPEIADYEVRRELLRANKLRGLARLEELVRSLEYMPLTTTVMRQAATFWAQARQTGRPTSGDKALDSDVILAAQAAVIGTDQVIIATTNVQHLARFVPADLWQNISA